MAEELATNIPTAFAYEEENDFPSGYSIDSPRGWYTKATISEPQGSASPSLPCTFDRVSGDEDCNGFLFTFPSLYSDLASEKDPFFDNRGMPLNPHNTPISQSGRQSEIGSCGKDKRHAPSPTKSDKHAFDRPDNSVRSDNSPLTSVFSGREATWRPPKPPKPSFLSYIDIPLQRRTENAGAFLRPRPPNRGDEKTLPETPYRSLPLRASRNLNRAIEHPATDQGPERRPARPKRPWKTRRVVPCRYFPRPFTRQELEVLGIPLNNPKKPFPAPIPTIDKLPLRRGTVNFDWKVADQYQVESDNSSTTKPNPPSARKESWSTLWRLSRGLFSIGQIGTNVFRYISLWKRSSSTKQKPTVRTTVTIPYVSRCETCTAEPGQASADLVDGAYVLQIDLTFPLLFVHRTASLVTVIRCYMSSKIFLLAVFLVRDLIKITARLLLYIFRVDVAIEVRRV